MEQFNSELKNCDEANGLTLNVFAPKWESSEFVSHPNELTRSLFVRRPNGRPVVVYIHGSGYEVSSSAERSDESISGQLPLQNIVLVSINYRLGFFGFLTTGDDNCRGNMGLWDQTLALKWVQKHIRSFGGNPDNVTLLGCSAGASSADLLSYSPHSRDLFHKYVSLSGAAFCDFAIRTSEDQLTISKEFATDNGYSGNDLFSWFKSQPVEVLSKLKTFQKSVSGFLNFAPNLDGDFFPKPLDKLKKEFSKKPAIFGIEEYEGIIFSGIDPSTENVGEKLKEKIELYYLEDIVDETRKNEIHQRIFDYYLNGVPENDTETRKKRAIEFVGDSLFNLGVLKSVRSSAKHGNDTYLYVFEYFNPKAFGPFEKFLPFKAASHGSDLRFIIGEGRTASFNTSDEDQKMIEKMTTIFANFAKTGNPGWQKYSLSQPQSHYAINYPLSEIRDIYQGGRCTSELWEDILEINKSHQKVVYGKIV